MPRVLLILQSIFSVWMLVDALRRGARSYWYWVILLPFGEVAYFFVVKIHDPEFDSIRALWSRLTSRKITLTELRFKLEQTPSFANTCTLAQALYDARQLTEAREMFERALQIRSDAKDAIYGLALTLIKLEERPHAIEQLRKLIDIDPSFQDYHPWADLADVLVRDGQSDAALTLLEDLVGRSPRINHRVLYAHYLLHFASPRDAERQLELGLAEFELVPKVLKRRQQAWAGKAKRMLKTARASQRGG